MLSKAKESRDASSTDKDALLDSGKVVGLFDSHFHLDRLNHKLRLRLSPEEAIQKNQNPEATIEGGLVVLLFL